MAIGIESYESMPHDELLREIRNKDRVIQHLNKLIDESARSEIATPKSLREIETDNRAAISVAPLCLECEEPRTCHDGDYCFKEHKRLSTVSASSPMSVKQINTMRDALIEAMTDGENEYPQEVETICDMAVKHILSQEAARSSTARSEPMAYHDMLKECLLWFKVVLPTLPDKGVKDTNRVTGEAMEIRPLQDVIRLHIRELEALLGKDVVIVHGAPAASSATRRTHDVLLAITHGYVEWEATGDHDKLVKAINEAEVHRQEIAPPQNETVVDVVPVDRTSEGT